MGRRIRLKNANNKKRILKGKSSESNPTITRHRDAARQYRLRQMIPHRDLEAKVTIDNAVDHLPIRLMEISQKENREQLEKHSGSLSDDEDQGESGISGKSENQNDGIPEMESGEQLEWGGMMSESGASNLTTLTSCTNPTFDVVHRPWRSGSDLQPDVLAVLGANAELLEENGEDQTDEKYFVTLLATLEAIPVSEMNRVAATAYALELAARKAHRGVVRKCFARAFQILYEKLVAVNDASALSKLITLFGLILYRQGGEVWSSSNTRSVLMKIAMFALHEKPSVRHSVKHVLSILLTDPVTGGMNGFHPAVHDVCDYLDKELKTAVGKDDAISVMRVLSLAQAIMHKTPMTLFRRFCDSTFDLLVSPDTMLHCAVYQCLYCILQQQPSDNTLSAVLIEKLIESLHKVSSFSSNIATNAYRLRTICEMHVCLSLKDKKRCVHGIMETLHQIKINYENANVEIAKVVTSAFTRLLVHCVADDASIGNACIDLCDKTLLPTNSRIWQYLFKVLAKVFEICKDSLDRVAIQSCLHTLETIRNNSDKSTQELIDWVIGAAVRYVGVESTLAALPLNIDPAIPAQVLHFERSWMIPILQKNIHNAKISFALHFFLPLAFKLRQKTTQLDKGAAKIYETIANQLWDLVSSILKSPVDFEESFPTLAEIMGKTSNEEPDLRMTIFSALRAALSFASKENTPENVKAILGYYSYSYLHQLFEFYTMNMDKEESPDSKTQVFRLGVYETIRMYMDLTPQKVINDFTKKAIQKLKDEQMSKQMMVVVLDLVILLVKRSSPVELGKIFAKIRPHFASNDMILQKKAFRILQEIFTRVRDPELAQFFAKFRDEISTILRQDVAKVAFSARCAMISLYEQNLWLLDSAEQIRDFSECMLDKIVISLDKAHNVRTRGAATNCFIAMCGRFIELEAGNQEGSGALGLILKQIYEMAKSDKEGNDELAVARSTTIALDLIAQNYMDAFKGLDYPSIIAHACSCVADGRPAVRVLVLKLLRTLVQQLPYTYLATFKDGILRAIFDNQPVANITNDVCKANKRLLEVLVEKLSAMAVLKKTNKTDWIKIIKAIDKRRRRRKARLARPWQGSDDSVATADDVMSTDSATSRTTFASSILDADSDSDESEQNDAEDQKTVWIEEGNDNEIINLLDRDTMLKKMSRKPPKSTDKRTSKEEANIVECPFEMTKDGRLIIENLETTQSSERRINQLKELFGIEQNEKPIHDECADESDSEVDDVKGSKKGSEKNVLKRRVSGAVTKKRRGDFKKKGAKYEPYAYIPLRKRGNRIVKAPK